MENKRTFSLRIKGRTTKESTSKAIGEEGKETYVSKNTIAVDINRETRFLNFELYSVSPKSIGKGQNIEMDASVLDMYEKNIYTLDGKLVTHDTPGAILLLNEKGYKVTETILTIKVNEKYCSENYFKEVEVRENARKEAEVKELKAKWQAELEEKSQTEQAA